MEIKLSKELNLLDVDYILWTYSLMVERRQESLIYIYVGTGCLIS